MFPHVSPTEKCLPQREMGRFRDGQFLHSAYQKVCDGLRVRARVDRFLMEISNHPGFGPLGTAHVLHQGIVHGKPGGTPPPAVIGSDRGRFQDGSWLGRSPADLQENVGPGNSLGMEPQVIIPGQVTEEVVVSHVVLAAEYFQTVGRAEAAHGKGCFLFFPS